LFEKIVELKDNFYNFVNINGKISFSLINKYWA